MNAENNNIPDPERLFRSIAFENDQEAFRILFETYYAPMCNYAYRYVEDKQGREDLVQDVFFHLWDKRNEIKISISFLAYLLMSVRNRCLNHIKRKGIESKANLMEYQNSLHCDSNAEEIYTASELQSLIGRAIAALPEKHRTAFLLHRNHKKTYQEIADLMSVSIKSVEAYMGKALKTLRSELREYLT
ncbi:DNA-directed RNA polymerase sigma-70 factor [Bacteroidales bacterium]|nr:DNA-directed RNA polymerase sigma-70 factor [Bacteroidales bacterium]